jgi:hypothetical protein
MRMRGDNAVSIVEGIVTSHCEEKGIRNRFQVRIGS